MDNHYFAYWAAYFFFSASILSFSFYSNHSFFAASKLRSYFISYSLAIFFNVVLPYGPSAFFLPFYGPFTSVPFLRSSKSLSYILLYIYTVFSGVRSS